MYVPYAQDPNWGSLTLVVRTTGEPTALAGSVREAIRSVDKAVPNYNLKTMNDVVSTSAAPRRVPIVVERVCGCGDVARDARNLRCDFLLRDAADARDRCAHGARAQIRDGDKLVLPRAMLLAVLGIGIGVAGAVAMTRYMTTLLFGVKPIDTVTFIAVAIVLAAVVLVACLVPARRARRSIHWKH